MQKNIYYFLLIGLLAASCGNTKKDNAAELNDKKARLQELKKDQRKLTEEILKLEAELGKLDSTATGKPKLVTLEKVSGGSFTHYVDLQGKIDATNISYVAPNGQGGVITAVYVKQGDYVRKGQTLLRLDDQLIRQQIEPLRVQLAAAEDTYRRTKNLWDQGIGTYQQVLSAKTQAESLRKQISVIQKQASLNVITAPSSGVADEVNVRVGEFFSPQTAAMPGAGIKIVNTGSLKVVAEIPENYLGKVGVGTNIKVQLPNANNRIIDTRVKVAGRLIDPRTRSFYIEAPIPSDPDFRPNQIAIVKVQDYASANAITIPLNTLQNDEKGKFVMVAVNENNKLVARKRQVVTGELYNDRLEVRSGLQSGDLLIKEGFQNLYEGQLLVTETPVQ